MTVSRQKTKPQLGIAYSSYVPELLYRYPDTLDFIEITFELLSHNPSIFENIKDKPLILHCSSLSIAGTVPPTKQTIQDIKGWIHRTKTPWIGEHISFISANNSVPKVKNNLDEPYNIGFTVAPPMNDSSVELIIQSILQYENDFNIPLLLENPPLYFIPPGSTMSQVDFIKIICNRTRTRLLLDLTHFYITSYTMGWTASQKLLELPLEKVVEVHLSGVDFFGGTYWDNHAAFPPEEVLELLSTLLSITSVKAVTLERNWPSMSSIPDLVDEVECIRELLAEVVK
jgi:uncharacterized protein